MYRGRRKGCGSKRGEVDWGTCDTMTIYDVLASLSCSSGFARELDLSLRVRSIRRLAWHFCSPDSKIEFFYLPQAASSIIAPVSNRSMMGAL